MKKERVRFEPSLFSYVVYSQWCGLGSYFFVGVVDVFCRSLAHCCIMPINTFGILGSTHKACVKSAGCGYEAVIFEVRLL